MSPAPPPALVVLDCDGVLVDSERLAVVVEAEVLTDLGWSTTPEDVVRRWMGRASDEQLAEVAQRLGDEAAARFDALSTARVHAAFETDLVAVPGVVGLLDALDAAGTPTCVASSGTHARIARTLGLTGLRDRFAGRVFSVEDVARGKPHPDLFLHAAQECGAPPERCAVVEDSVYGVRAAVAAGMTAYGFAGGLTAAGALADAGAVVVHAMDELVDLLAHSSSSSA